MLANLRQKGRPGTPKTKLWRAFGRLWASPGALVTASGANVCPEDTPLRSSTISKPKKSEPGPPKEESAASAAQPPGGGKLHI